MSYVMIKDIHIQNLHRRVDTYGIRVRRKFKTKGTVGRRRFERFIDVNLLANASPSYYKEFLNMKEEDARRIKKNAIIISKCDTVIKDLTIQDVLSKNNISASDIMTFYNTIQTCTENEIVISDAVELTHFTYSIDKSFMSFHLLLNFNKDTRKIYSCYYDKDKKIFYIQNEDRASYLLFK